MRSLILATAFTLIASASLAGSESYNPGREGDPASVASEKAPAAEKKPSQAEQAKQRFADWQKSKRECYTAAGLKEGVDFRVKPDDDNTFQINDRVWRNSKVDTAALEKCR